MLASSNCFEVIYSFAAPDARQYIPLFVLSIVRNHNHNWLADRLFGGETEHALRPAIPTRDYPIEILADDSIVTGFNDRGQRAQSFLCSFAVTQVARNRSVCRNFA